MFLNKYNRDLYGRARVYRIKFISFTLKSFSTKNVNTYEYIADYEFLKQLEKLTGVDYKVKELLAPDKRAKRVILLDLLPIEIMALLRLSNNIIYTFESYFDDDTLHLLAKGEAK